jgi:hypothetical protein
MMRKPRTARELNYNLKGAVITAFAKHLLRVMIRLQGLAELGIDSLGRQFADRLIEIDNEKAERIATAGEQLSFQRGL